MVARLTTEVSAKWMKNNILINKNHARMHPKIHLMGVRAKHDVSCPNDGYIQQSISGQPLSS